MLHELWKMTLATRAEDLAVTDSASGATWSFAALQRELDLLEPLSRGEVHVAPLSSGPVRFVLETLRAWRDGAVLCPVENGVPRLPRPAQLPSGVCHLKLTSGSTGEPRWVLFTAPQLIADETNIRTTMGLDPAFPNVAVISLAHSYGFSSLVLPLLLRGHSMILVPDPMPSSKRQANTLGCRYTLPAVPAMWRAWHQAGLLHDAPIELAISAGAPLPLELEQAVHSETGIKIHNFYGSSECGGIAYDDSKLPRTDASLAGRAMRGVKLHRHEDGCLVVQSGAVGAGYWPPGDSALGGGIFVTSDLVEFSGDAVHLRGRLSDTINIAGRKLNPADVEAALLSFEGVEHCVVFGVPSADAARCEETVACVNASGDVTGERLAHFLGEKLPAWQRPRRYWICPDLAPNARGKFSRAEWRGRFLAQTRPQQEGALGKWQGRRSGTE